MLGLFLQGENLDSDLEWLDPVTAAIERRSLLEGVACRRYALEAIINVIVYLSVHN
jgi:hypothetical protein